MLSNEAVSNTSLRGQLSGFVADSDRGILPQVVTGGLGDRHSKGGFQFRSLSH